MLPGGAAHPSAARSCTVRQNGGMAQQAQSAGNPDAPGVIRIGVIGGGPPSLVDPFGTLHPFGAGWSCEWWIGGDDRWHLPVH